MLKIALVGAAAAFGAWMYGELHLSDAVMTIAAAGSFVALLIFALLRDA